MLVNRYIKSLIYLLLIRLITLPNNTSEPLINVFPTLRLYIFKIILDFIQTYSIHRIIKDPKVILP